VKITTQAHFWKPLPVTRSTAAGENSVIEHDEQHFKTRVLFIPFSLIGTTFETLLSVLWVSTLSLYYTRMGKDSFLLSYQFLQKVVASITFEKRTYDQISSISPLKKCFHRSVFNQILILMIFKSLNSSSINILWCHNFFSTLWWGLEWLDEFSLE